MVKCSNVFVTVGTTKFDDLIFQILSDDTLKSLKRVGCERLVLQTGRLNIPLKEVNFPKSINIQAFEYKSSILEDILSADLVIGHCGAGTILDVLRNNKPLIVVTNRKLMNNHQEELANKLEEEGHLISCQVESLASAIEQFDPSILKPLPRPNFDTFPKFLDQIFGL